MQQTLIEEKGLMDAEKAAERLGVKVPWFNKYVAPNIGNDRQRINGKKLYTELELTQWLDSQIGEANISNGTKIAST